MQLLALLAHERNVRDVPTPPWPGLLFGSGGLLGNDNVLACKQGKNPTGLKQLLK